MARSTASPRSHHTRGSTLLQSLVFSVVSGTLLAGAGSLVVSHRIRAEAERGFARAVYVAESGLQAELASINDGPPAAGSAHQAFLGQSLDVTQEDERYVVSVKDAEEVDKAWAPPNDLLVESLGVAHGVSRMIQARVTGRSVFADYALFGIHSLAFNGSGSGTNGDIGTNGTISASASGSSVTSGKIVFHGSNPSLNGANVYREPDPYWWPSVETIAASQFASGLSTLKQNNNNANILRFNDNRYLDPNFELAWAENAGLTWSDVALTNQSFSEPVTNGNGRDKPKNQGGKRYSSTTDGVFEKNVLIFPPGDYYFESLEVTSGQTAILVDNRLGSVRIWVGGTGTGHDRLQTTIIFTNNNRMDRFRLYYAKRAELRIAGNTDFPGLEVPGLIYAVNQTGDASVDISGNSYITGSIIANTLRISGNSYVDFPAGGPAAPGDPVRRYDKIVWWREVTPGVK